MKSLRTVSGVGVLILAAVTAIALAQGPSPKPTRKPAPQGDTSATQKISYLIGRSYGEQLKDEPFAVDAKLLVQGLQDGLAGAESRFSQEEIDQAMKQVQQEVKDKMTKLAADNKKQGEKFLADNGKKTGVKTTKSGLQYQVIKAGTGPTPKPTDAVSAHYEGKLLDGTEFDSSYKRGEPATFAVQGVIPGWTEALQLMKVGSKWKLFIPAELAYGANPSGGPIPPNATLVFTVELLGIEKPLNAPEELEPISEQ